MRKGPLAAAFAAAAVAGVLSFTLSHHEQGVTLTVSTPGGSLQTGLRAALWAPASEELGYRIKEKTADNALDVLRLETAAHAVTTDIVIMSAYQAAIAGNEGALEPIDYHVVDTRDFLPSATPRYCVGIYGYAAVLAWNTHVYGNTAPTSWADFWNVSRFPGPRAMRADAESQLEMALLADGVSEHDLYAVLATEDGLKRAIRKIRELKSNISVWWSSGAQHAQLMKDGEVDMSTGWNGRFQAAKDAGGPVNYTYNQGILSFDCFAVTKASKHKAEAMRLISAMSSAQSQAKLTQYVSYGPLNTAAFQTGLISKEKAAALPTSPENVRLLILQDVEWWTRNNNRAQQLFENMMTE